MKGKLFGIGVGPGDPQLLTLKAVSVIKKCSVIAVPATPKQASAAYAVIESYLAEKELLECSLTMAKDLGKRQKARQNVAEQIICYLKKGQDVGYVTLGDPTTYSTYMYLHEIIVKRGYVAEIIPGVTSYAAAAAALGIALCEGGETLTIVPAGYEGNLAGLLDSPGNKVIVKSGENLAALLANLKERGYGNSTKIAYRVTMKGQRLYNSIEDYEKSPANGYFITAIVKERINKHEP